MFLYSIRDRVTEEFSPPFVAKNHAVAMRKFKGFINDLSEVSKGDFVVVCHSEWSPEGGLLKCFTTPIELSVWDAEAGRFNDLTDII